MGPNTIARINELAHKAKTVGLTAEEIAERDTLRRNISPPSRQTSSVSWRTPISWMRKVTKQS